MITADQQSSSTSSSLSYTILARAPTRVLNGNGRRMVGEAIPSNSAGIRSANCANPEGSHDAGLAGHSHGSLA